MSELKTKKNESSVTAFLNSIEDKEKRDNCYSILKMMEEATAEKAKMWGDSIVGFGTYHYKYDSGREGDWFKTGFSSRKQNITVYIMSGFDNYDSLMSNLGKYKTGKSCLYIKNLNDINTDVLKELISESLLMLDRMYGNKAEA